MNLSSQKSIVQQNQKDLFQFLSNMENYEQLMPDNTQKFALHESGQGFKVRIGALPEVGMKLKSQEAFERISFESPSENFVYDLTVFLNRIKEDETEVWIEFNGQFNPMIEMMAKKPLQNFIDTIVAKLAI